MRANGVLLKEQERVLSMMPGSPVSGRPNFFVHVENASIVEFHRGLRREKTGVGLVDRFTRFNSTPTRDERTDMGITPSCCVGGCRPMGTVVF